MDRITGKEWLLTRLLTFFTLSFWIEIYSTFRYIFRVRDEFCRI